MDAPLIATLFAATTVVSVGLNAVLAVKLSDARMNLADAEEDKAALREANKEAHQAVAAQEFVIREQGVEIAEHRSAKQRRERQAAAALNRAREVNAARAAGKANGKSACGGGR